MSARVSTSFRLEAMIIGTALSLLAVAVGDLIKIDHDSTLEWATARAETEARLIDEHAKVVFQLSNRAIERTLSAIANTPLPHVADTREKWSRLREIADDLAEDGSIWIIDRNGDLVFTSATFEPPALNYADREYFQAHAAGDAYHVGGVQTGKLTGSRFFSVSRRIDTNGVFAGVVLVTVRPTFFTDFYASIGLGPRSSIAMLRNDGAVLAREPRVGDEARAPIAAAMPPSIDYMVNIGPSSIDREDRIAALRRVPGQPVIVSVALSADRVFESWRRRTGGILAISAVAFALLIALSVVALGARRRERAALVQAQTVSDNLAVGLEREKLMRAELAHRTKNNLALMIAMLNVEGGRARGEGDSFRATAGRIRALALAQQLLDDPRAGGRIDCADYLGKIASTLVEAEATHKIGLQMSVEPIALPAEKAQALGLIENELLTNSIKYAFRGRAGGTVSVGLHAEEDRILFTYADDGGGFRQSAESAKDSKGLRLIDALARTLGATYTITGADGAKFSLVLPSLGLKESAAQSTSTRG